MMRVNIRRPSAWAVFVLLGIELAACKDVGHSLNDAASGPSRAFSLWAPGVGDTCTREVHDKYAVVGPDQRLYPTWHPPVDPGTGCSFGHEHGRDPSGSRLAAAVGDIPFGYANEQLETWDPTGVRREDHVGHKVEWQNDIALHFGGAVGNALLELKCDVLTKLHQGTHSKDAFTNNLHELVYHIRCKDGTRMDVTLMSAIGEPGEFVRSCDRDSTVHAGVATPANSPRGNGHRAIPDRGCVEQHAFVATGKTSDFDDALHESWETSNEVRTADDKGIAFFNPYFQVRYPSRYFDASQADNTGRPASICFETLPNGMRARGETCTRVTAGGLTALAYDDVRSPFDGATRTVDINYNEVRNEDGPEVWFTDPFGKHGRQCAAPGSVDTMFRCSFGIGGTAWRRDGGIRRSSSLRQ